MDPVRFASWKTALLCVVVMAASRAFAGPSTGSNAQTTRISDPHADVLRYLSDLAATPAGGDIEPTGASALQFEYVPTPVSGMAYSNAIDDFDADGNLDVAMASFDNAETIVYFGDGQGSFPRTLPLDQVGVLIAAGFINSDSLPDIVGINAYFPNGWIDVRLNNGDGAFAPGIISPLVHFDLQLGLALGYLNDDPWLDLIAGTGEVWSYYGDGAGHFTTGTFISDGYTAGIADLNDDGFADVVVGYNTVKLFLGDGTGNLALSDEFNAGGAIFTLQTSLEGNIIDFNEDGHADVVITFPRAEAGNPLTVSDVYVLFGDGTGHVASSLQLASGGTCYPVTTLDFDYDGHLDLAVGSSSRKRIYIYHGDGLGGIRADVDTVDTSPRWGPVSLGVGDFREDGLWDFVCAYVGSGVLLNTGASAAVLSGEQMVTKGLNNACVRVINPLDLGIDLLGNHNPGGRLRNFDVDGDGNIDQNVYDLNVQDGVYAIDLWRAPDASDGALYSLDLTLDGMSYRLARNATVPAMDDTIRFVFPNGPSVMVAPRPGSFTPPQPTFDWSDAATAGKSSLYYEIQIDDNRDFSSPEIAASNLLVTRYTPPQPLLTDTLYYWRFRECGGGCGPYSDAFAVNIVACACADHVDPVCDGVTDVLDVVAAIEAAFRNGRPSFDGSCPNFGRTDADCNGVTDVVDAVRIIAVAFRAADPAAMLCDYTGR